jgi:serine/threonine-protein kinase HipA
MSKNNIISVFCFNAEIGVLGHDSENKKSYFQYNPVYLENSCYKNLFPLSSILKRIRQTQVFSRFNNETFRGLPPMFADSLPDSFGNIIFRKWLESLNREYKDISVLEQLAYVGKRGMGALEYLPAKEIPESGSINLEEILWVLEKVMTGKTETKFEGVKDESILNIFKIGSSAGGARPKILISEHKENAAIIPGDLSISDEYNHYLVKLSTYDLGYSRETIEYIYYLTAISLNIDMMPSKLIDEKHFATLRFDRVNGQKKHIQTASGLTGWDFNDPKVSSYENLFELSLFLKLPQKDIDELYRRMIFNLVFSNRDDHLKNHSFVYNEIADSWNLSPAYDLTYSLNPLLNFSNISRALSVNGKRTNILLSDLHAFADRYSIKNFTGIIKNTVSHIDFWKNTAEAMGVPEKVLQNIINDFYIPK